MNSSLKPTCSFFRNLFKGYSLNRLLRDDFLLRNIQLTGRVLDVGGGEQPYYWNYFGDCHLTSADMNPQLTGGIIVDLEAPLPIESNTYDGIICLSVLEHVFNYDQLVKEIFRIKKPEAYVHFWIPFMIQPHGPYGDYFRFTDFALKKIFLEAGYQRVEVSSLNNFFWVMGNMCSQTMYEKSYMRPLLVFLNIIFILLGKLFRSSKANRWPIGYFVKAI